MKLPDRSELDVLMTTREQPWVSIFMPAHRPGADGQQDPIRLKNLIRQAEERLVALDLRLPDARKMLTRAQKLVGDDLFWRQQQEGLAVYCAPSSFRFYRLPIRFEEMLVVGRRPHVRPLLPLLVEKCRFLVLALSRQQVRFFRASRHSIEEVSVESIPHSFEEAMKYDEFDKPRARWVQSAGQGRAGRAEGSAAYRGQGGEAETRRENVLRYFQMIDRGLHPLLRDEKAPLVVSAVDYAIPIYREANTYAHLFERGVEGSPDGLKAEEIHRQAWQIVAPHFRTKQREAAEKFASLSGTGRTSRDVRDVVPAAYQGRIDTLWVASGAQVWGTYDPADNSVQLSQSSHVGVQELLDVAAVQTLLASGTVYPLDRLAVPGESQVAAIFRY
jgi:hypothetical protein